MSVERADSGRSLHLPDIAVQQPKVDLQISKYRATVNRNDEERDSIGVFV